MKKLTKKTPKASQKKAIRNLGVKPAKGRTVRGGLKITKHIDKASPKIYENL